MDEFAQTGAQQDDLFDEIQYTPGGEASMQTRAPDDLFGDDFTPTAEPVVVEQPQEKIAFVPQTQHQPAPTPARAHAQTQQGQTGQRGGRGGGGRGRGGQARGGRARDSPKPRDNAVPRSPTTQAPPSDTTATAPTEITESTKTQSAPAPRTGSLWDSRHAPANPSAPKAAAEETPSSDTIATPTTISTPPVPTAPTAARGDRRATGGPMKTKLTPAELEAKMARMTLRNSELTERHARAEADRASFDKREEVAKEVAKQRIKEERRDRQQMMGEREKNRMRKLKAMEGREWDAEKQEADYDHKAAGQGTKEARRGAHGGVVGSRGDEAAAAGFGGQQEDYNDGREYMYRENRGRGGGRGRGAGRGGRGGRGNDAGQQRAPQHEDFPDLPAAATSTAKSESGTQAPALSFPKKAAVVQESAPAAGAATPPLDMSTPRDEPGSKSWADMVESAAT